MTTDINRLLELGRKRRIAGVDIRAKVSALVDALLKAHPEMTGEVLASLEGQVGRLVTMMAKRKKL